MNYFMHQPPYRLAITTLHPTMTVPFLRFWKTRLFFKGILSGFRHFTKNPDYFIAQSFGYYGYIKPEHADCVIIIGPVFSTPISDLTLRTFMQEWAISQEHKPDILQFLVNIPQISFNQFLQTLAWLHLCFNDEYISVGQHFNLENTSIISEFSNVHSNQVMNAKEEQHFHNTYI